MNERIVDWLNLVFQLGTLALVVIIPLFFWDLSSEFYETPKFFILLTAVAVMFVLWAARWIIEGKVTFVRTPLDLPFLLLLIVFIISTLLSPSRSVAVLGNFPHLHGGLATFVVYILFYFTLTSNLRKISLVTQLTQLFLILGSLLAILSLLSYNGVNFLTLPWTAAQNFTPTGSSFSTTAILALILPFPLVAILHGNGNEILGNLNYFENNTSAKLQALLNKIILTAILILLSATITLTGSMATYLASALVYVLALSATSPILIKKNLQFVIAPLVIAGLLVFFSFAPVGGSKNFLYDKAKSFPKEVQLSLSDSWKISISTFRDNPFWGSGPGSYQFDFTAYKPIEFNNSKFWNVRFDSAFNEYLQVLATLGATGLIALVLLTSVFLSLAIRALSSPGSAGLSWSISGIIFFTILALHPSTLPLWAMGILILASFLIIHKDWTKQVYIGTAPARGISYTDGNLYLHFDVLPTVAMALILVIMGSGLYLGSRLALADYHHRQALKAVTLGQGLNTYNELIKAEMINPYADVYRTDLAQTNFALANAIATAKGPTEASPGGSLTDTDKHNIQTLLYQSISKGQIATTLSPNNSANWEILALIYRQISGVAQNALTFSLDSYGRAISKDPYNPALRLTVGGIYYSVKNYDLAIRFFSDAVNLKPDYANAYYNLAVALRDKGDLVSAASSAERTVSLLDPKNADYKTASDLLASLKEQIANESDKTQATSAATIKEEAPKKPSALQSKNLPKVLDLPQPENIATPPAVKKQTQE